MSLSLIPYQPREGREIVLRHHNAIVVRDSASQRLEIRGLTECPTCHQPMRATSPDRPSHATNHRDTYVDPNYFRMLRAGSGSFTSLDPPAAPDRPPSSPVRRLVEPFKEYPDSPDGPHAPIEVVEDAEFVSSAPAVPAGSRIRREAFSPNYFKTFFVEERELGRGGKGVVLLVRHEIDGCQLGHFACKRVPVGDDHAWLEKVLVEVELLAKLSHPNLVSYRHVWLEDTKISRFSPSVACAFILQQYCNNGDLLRYVAGAQPGETTTEERKAQMRRKSKSHGAERPRDLSPSLRHLPLEEIFSLFKDITSGLAYLHAANYIHRDLKPSNCLLHQEGNQMICLISDFGEVQPENAVRKSTGSTGTISYCAPEVLTMNSGGRYGNFTTKSDIFSLGMILYFMCFGHLPYRNANAIQEELEDIDLLRAEITDWKGFQDEKRERPELPSKLYQLLKKLLATNPAERPSANEVLSVMRNESTLDGVARPSIGLSSRRIHDLDSPQRPSSPFPDPNKQPQTPPSSQEDLQDNGSKERSSSKEQNILQKRSVASRYRAPAMQASASQDGVYRRSSADGSAPVGDELGRVSPQPSSPPLLMAPPSTFLGDMHHRGLVVRHQTMLFLNRNAESTALFVRLCLFLVKMFSLTRTCWPFVVNWEIGAGLIALAGLDLGIPASRPRLVPSHSHPGGVSPRYDVDGGSGALGSRLRWDWRVSSVLLIAHLTVLWFMSRWNLLCATSVDHEAMAIMDW